MGNTTSLTFDVATLIVHELLDDSNTLHNVALVNKSLHALVIPRLLNHKLEVQLHPEVPIKAQTGICEKLLGLYTRPWNEFGRVTPPHDSTEAEAGPQDQAEQWAVYVEDGDCWQQHDTAKEEVSAQGHRQRPQCTLKHQFASLSKYGAQGHLVTYFHFSGIFVHHTPFEFIQESLPSMSNALASMINLDTFEWTVKGGRVTETPGKARMIPPGRLMGDLARHPSLRCLYIHERLEMGCDFPCCRIIWEGEGLGRADYVRKYGSNLQVLSVGHIVPLRGGKGDKGWKYDWDFDKGLLDLMCKASRSIRCFQSDASRLLTTVGISLVANGYKLKPQVLSVRGSWVTLGPWVDSIPLDLATSWPVNVPEAHTASAIATTNEMRASIRTNPDILWEVPEKLFDFSSIHEMRIWRGFSTRFPRESRANQLRSVRSILCFTQCLQALQRSSTLKHLEIGNEELMMDRLRDIFRGNLREGREGLCGLRSLEVWGCTRGTNLLRWLGFAQNQSETLEELTFGYSDIHKTASPNIREVLRKLRRLKRVSVEKWVFPTEILILMQALNNHLHFETLRCRCNLTAEVLLPPGHPDEGSVPGVPTAGHAAALVKILNSTNLDDPYEDERVPEKELRLKYSRENRCDQRPRGVRRLVLYQEMSLLKYTSDGERRDKKNDRYAEWNESWLHELVFERVKVRMEEEVCVMGEGLNKDVVEEGVEKDKDMGKQQGLGNGGPRSEWEWKWIEPVRVSVTNFEKVAKWA